MYFNLLLDGLLNKCLYCPYHIPDTRAQCFPNMSQFHPQDSLLRMVLRFFMLGSWEMVALRSKLLVQITCLISSRVRDSNPFSLSRLLTMMLWGEMGYELLASGFLVRIHLPIPCKDVGSILVGEDSTCLGSLTPCTTTAETVLCSKRSLQ